MQYKESIYGKSGGVMFYRCVFCACYLDAGNISVTFYLLWSKVSGPGSVIILEVFLGNPCLAWKVGCLEKGTEREPFA